MKHNQTPIRVIQPLVQIRAEPNGTSEVISQAIFSEELHILEKAGEWLKVMTPWDNYTGWIKQEGVCNVPDTYTSRLNVESVWVDRLTAHIYHVKDTIYGPLMTLPYNSRLVLVQPVAHHSDRWLNVLLPDGKEVFIQSGDVVSTRPLLSNDQACELALTFLGLPYTWGGRSSFGYDCSGFVQMLYQARGVNLPRDAKDQAKMGGFSDVALTSLKEGDLLFFGFAEDAIKHVAMSLGEDLFIHTCASVENAPYLRISSLKDPAWNGKGFYPHRLGRRL